jgi:hypothetical protein
MCQRQVHEKLAGARTVHAEPVHLILSKGVGIGFLATWCQDNTRSTDGCDAALGHLERAPEALVSARHPAEGSDNLKRRDDTSVRGAD